MRDRALLAVVALLAGAAPVAAGPRAARPAAEPDAAGLRALYALLAPGPAKPPYDTVPDTPLRAGDLDGDGGEEIALAWPAYTRDGTGTGSLDVHHGRTGDLLWHVPLPSRVSYPVFTKVGARGDRGLVLVSYDDLSPDTQTSAAPVRVRSYDATGKKLWTFEGASRVVVTRRDAAGGGAVAGTVVYGLGNLVRGGGTDLLVGTTVWAPDGNPGESRWVLRLEVVDGATGAAQPVGETLHGVAESVSAAVVGDLDGDGLDDYVVTTGDREATGRRPAVRAFRSSTGTPLWTTNALPAHDDDLSVVPLPDVTGDRRPDLAVRVGYDVAVGVDDNATITLLDGAAGRPLWTRPGAQVELLTGGRATRLLLRRNVDRRGVDVAAYTPGGKGLWSLRRVLPRALRPAHYDEWAGPVGDVDGDGDADFAYSLSYRYDDGSERVDNAVVDGGSGRVLARPGGLLRGSPRAVDGRRAGLVSASVERGVLTVVVWDGRGRRVWTSAVEVRPGGTTLYQHELAGLLVVPVDRDRCADVVAVFQGAAARLVTLSGATGRGTWWLGYDREPAAPAQRGRVPSRRYC